MTMKTPDSEAEVASHDLLACPHCGSAAKIQSSMTATWVSCSNVDDPCPGYDTDWTGIQPMRIGGAMALADAKEGWNYEAQRRSKANANGDSSAVAD